MNYGYLSRWTGIALASVLLWLTACSADSDEATEPLSFSLRGEGCDGDIDYTAPPDARLTLITSPKGKVQAFYVADGPLVNPRDLPALESYADNYDLMAYFALDEQARLKTGSLGPVSQGSVMARGLGSLALFGFDGNLKVTDLQTNRFVAVSAKVTVDAQQDDYPAMFPEVCDGGEVRAKFEGGYTTWDGQDDCFSPTKNVDRVGTDLVVGCACNSEQDESVCVTVCSDPEQGFGEGLDCNGRAIALFCIDDQWSWGHDGPCGT